VRRLYIIRHANASHEEHFPSDVYRTLTPKGYAEAVAAASWLNGERKPELLISSPAVRAFSTALVFADILRHDADRILLQTAMYEASCFRILNIIRQTKNADVVALFAHNPGVTDLVNLLCENVINGLKTGAIAVLDIACEWKDADAGKGVLAGLYGN
jgi:phosphohistidine phosphatase